MKTRRHSLILRLLDAHSVESHDQLASLLAAEGIDVNQATLSRDLRSLGVVKAPLPGGGARYRSTPGPPDRSVALANLRAFLHDIIPAGNMLVVKTRVGGAQPVGLALDQLDIKGIAGTLAGDDTVLAVVADGHPPSDVAAQIWGRVDESSAA
ncbi:MAG: arginine repressor [Myxococcota bacterium]